MAVELVIKIPDEMYKWINDANKIFNDYGISDFIDLVKNGTLLPEGYGELFDKAEILRFLKCPKYENCDWKNCFDCNESRCINLNNVNDLVPIIEADKADKVEIEG